ncbi:MAG TPA: HAD-IA family hydrolase [Acidimicrobiia bacterium]|jgi:putative hydrolase of the HAD superfamily|nr:HAD-IA family hydrolase [Acidimicrobiia bacterium]
MTAPPNVLGAVFFDFAGTLFSARDLRDSHLAHLRAVADAVGVHPSDDEVRAAYRQGVGVAYRAIAARPYYRHRELFASSFAAMAEALGGALDDATCDALVDRQYASTVEATRLRPDCLDVLGALRARGLRVQIVSNIDDEQLDGLVHSLGLDGFVDTWTSSESAQSCKPDPRIYQVALAEAACDAAEVLFVGDTVDHDVAGPRAAGMRTALLVADARPGAADGGADFVIERLGEVVDLVDRELAA